MIQDQTYLIRQQSTNSYEKRKGGKRRGGERQKGREMKEK
jgi:hypothetical protein